MQTFKDTEGREWTLVVNVGAVKRVKALLDVDLLETIEGRLLDRFIGNPVLLCDVIYALCKPQADAQQITSEQFGQAMAGDVIDDATAAFLQALVNFFPSTRRAVLQKALEKVRRLEGMALDHASEVLDSDRLERVMREHLEALDPAETVKDHLAALAAPGGSSTEPPERSA